MERLCHRRHMEAEEAVVFIREPDAVPREKHNTLFDLLMNIGATEPLCGEFGTWWSSELLRGIQLATGTADTTIRSALVLAWFQLTEKLLNESEAYCPLYPLTSREIAEHPEKGERPDTREHITDLIRHCTRFRRISRADWTRTFTSAVKRNPACAEALVLHLSSFLSLLDESQAVACSQAVAERAVEQPQLRMPFLSMAYHYAKRFVGSAHALLPQALQVGASDPVRLLPQLGQYLLAIPNNDTTRSQLLNAHQTIHGWIHAKEEAGECQAVASLRRSQERFVFHLQTRPPRRTHRATPSGAVKARIRLGGSPEAVVEGFVADVSVGRDTEGRGVRILLPEWQARQESHIKDDRWGDSILHLNSFSFEAAGGGQPIRANNPDVEIRWGSRTLKSSTYSVRAVDTTSPSFCVLFLTARDSDFLEWARYVHGLDPVDYGFTSGPV